MVDWAALLARLRGGEPTEKNVAAVEKRNAWRVFHKVKLKGERGKELFELVATNFGPGGMRIETATRLKKNDEIKVQVPRVTVADDTFSVRVVWCRKRTDAVHEAGVVFAGSEAENRMSAARFLLEECKLSIQNPQEKRKAPRVAAERMSAVFATPDGEVTQAQVIDLGVGGVQLLSPRRVVRGTDIDLKVTLARDLQPILCKGTVVRSTAEGQLKTSQLAVAFTDVPNDHKERLVGFLSRLLRG